MPRARRQLVALAAIRSLVGLAALTASACSVSQDGIPPPKSRIFLPEGALVDGRWLYVVNSNSDLRYNNGTLAIVDLDKVAADRDPTQSVWPSCPADSRYVPAPNAPHGCCWDFLDPAILNCDEQAYIKSDATVRIGSFGGRPQLHVTDFGRRLLIPVRGNSSISMVHLDEASDPAGPRLVCTGPTPKRCAAPNLSQEPFAVCEPTWRIDRFLPASNTQTTADLQNLNVALPDEPYGMAVDNFQQILYVGHLQTGLLSLIDLAAEQGPRLVTVFGAAVPANAAGSRGITSLLKVDQGQGASSVYVTSRFRPVVTSVVAIGAGAAPTCEAVAAQGSVDPAQCQPASGNNDVACNGARDLAVVGGGEVMDTGFANGAETRGLALSHDRATAWILQRTPPAVVAVDRSPNPINGLPLDLPFASTEVCVNPAFMEAHEAPDGLFLYVSCFDTGEIYVVDAQQNRVRDVIEVGRGPAGMVFDQSGARSDLGYVLGFGANNLSVVDVAPGSPTRHRVIQRIGFPSQTPRDFEP